MSDHQEQDSPARGPGAVRTEKLAIVAVMVNRSIQSRAKGLDEGHVADIAAAYRLGAAVPRVVVWKVDLVYRLSQGFHRIEAAKRAGLTHLECEVRVGTELDWKLDALCSNQGHGLKRSPDDKRRAIRQVVKLCPKWTDRRVAEAVGVDHKTVADERAKLEATGEIPQLVTRVGKDGKERPATRPERPPQPGVTPAATPHPDQPPAAEHDEPPEPGAFEDDPDLPEGRRPAAAEGGVEVPHPVVPQSHPAPRAGRASRPTAVSASDPAQPQVDGLGRPVPANLLDVFADEFLPRAADLLSKLAGQLQSASSYASWLPPTVPEVLRKASADVRDARAFAVHQGCGGRGCDGCMAGGYLPQWMQHDLLEAERGAPPAAGTADSAQPPGVPALAGVYTPRIVAGRPGHQVVLDAFSNPVPAGVGDAFADTSLQDLLTEATAAAELLESAYQSLVKLKAGSKAAAQHPWVELPAAEARLLKCRNEAVAFADLLRAGLPYAVCPRCSGNGCKDCRTSGYWPKHECDLHPELFRQKKGA